MKTKLIVISLVFIAVLTGCNKPKKKTIIPIENEMVGMIGYGSLLSKISMEETLKRTYTDSVYQVHLEGYQRTWNYVYSINDPDMNYYYAKGNDTIAIKNIIALNIEEAKDTQMNCALFFITPEELAQFDEREQGYDRIDVTNSIAEYAFTGGKVYVYKANKEHVFNFDDEGQTVLPKSYLDLVTKACDSMGVDYRKEFNATTKNLDKVTVLSDKDVFWTMKSYKRLELSESEFIQYQDSLRRVLLQSKPNELLKKSLLQELYIRGLVQEEGNSIAISLPFDLHGLDGGAPDCYTTKITFEIPKTNPVTFPDTIMVDIQEEGCASFIENGESSFVLTEQSANYINYYSAALQSNLIIKGDGKVYYYPHNQSKSVSVQTIENMFDSGAFEKEDVEVVPYQTTVMNRNEYEYFLEK